jgi:2-C-methyl-D-erythritol 4-phosphate cytidylyltransferase
MARTPPALLSPFGGFQELACLASSARSAMFIARTPQRFSQAPLGAAHASALDCPSLTCRS